MDLLLNTHVWIWLTLEKPKLLSANSKRAINSADHKWV